MTMIPELASERIAVASHRHGQTNNHGRHFESAQSQRRPGRTAIPRGPVEPRIAVVNHGRQSEYRSFTGLKTPLAEVRSSHG